MSDMNEDQISDVFRQMEAASNNENTTQSGPDAPGVDPSGVNPGDSFTVPAVDGDASKLTDPFKTDYQSQPESPGNEPHKVNVKEESVPSGPGVQTNNNNENSDGTGSARQEPEPFAGEKKDVSEFEETEPFLGLDKEKIKTVVIVAVVLVIVSIIFIPEIQRKLTQKKAAEAKPKTEQFSIEGLDRGQSPLTDEDKGEPETPPAQESKENKFTQEPSSPPVTNNSGVSLADVPDTRNDGLQDKNIRGIKGLTSGRTNFATDYEQTVVYNSEKAEEELNPYRNYLPNKEDYTNKTLASVSNMSNSYKSQNDQAGKESFHSNNSENAGYGEFLGLNTLWEGSIFEAELLTAINTDLPGECTAVITKNIYSSQNGKYLLIPQNSRLIGTYNSSISYAQSRVQVAWTTIIRPDGYRLNIGNFNATDVYGMAGLKGIINDHPMQYLKAIGIMGAFSALNIELQNQAGSYKDNEYIQDLLADSIQVSNTLGNKLIDRAMDVQPSIKIKAGTVIKVFVNQTLTLPPYEQYPVTQKYRR